MKKRKKKRLLIVIICIVAVLLIVVGGFLLKMNSEQKNMAPLETGEFLPGIYAIDNGFVNMFLIKADTGYIAVDAGVDVNSVKEGLSRLGISGDDVGAVLLTHTHADHTAALKLFDKATVFSAKQDPAYNSVTDGLILEVLGKRVQVISATGHAGDSVCYLYDGKYLFAGDNMSLSGNNVGLFNSVYNRSDDQQREDIKKLAELSGVECIITAHYGMTDAPVFP